jgi:hypothetical protein
VNITFTDSCPLRLGRGIRKNIIFVHPGDVYTVPEDESGEAQFWIDSGWAKEDSVVEEVVAPKKGRKGFKGTGPVTKGEPKG